MSPITEIPARSTLSTSRPAPAIPPPAILPAAVFPFIISQTAPSRRKSPGAAKLTSLPRLCSVGFLVASRINSPKVIHQVFDTEVVVVNLETGNYYSVTGSGIEAWQGLE